MEMQAVIWRAEMVRHSIAPTIVIVIIPIFSFIPQINLVFSSSDDGVPFIYYYSEGEEAFIIERANGADKRILTNFTFPEQHTVIEGDGWSPTGQWFVWTSRPSGGRAHYNMNVFIVDRSGTETQLLPFDPADSIQSMQWSPDRDLLLIPFFDTSDVLTLNIMVYDPVSQVVLLQRRFSENHYIPVDIMWSPDSQFVAIVYTNSVRFISVDDEESLLVDVSGFPDTGCAFGVMPRWLATDRFAYINRDQTALIIEGKTTADLTSIQLPVPLSDGKFQLADWSDDETRVALYFQPLSDPDKTQLWVISLSEQSVQLVSEDVLFAHKAPFRDSL
jgi:WD40 repeat protein